MMQDEYKQRVWNALKKYNDRQKSKNEIRAVKRNKKPEKIVEKEVLSWCKSFGFDVDVIDSKAAFNPNVGRYISQNHAPSGMSDLVGNAPNGMAAFIELKAKGRRVRSALDTNQRTFLERKIRSNAFACVVDSSELLEVIWNGFLISDNRQLFLLEHLP